MTAQGNPRTTYQRALRAGDPMLVLSALRDVASPTLGETLMACLVLARAGDSRAPRALARWHARWVADHDAPFDRSRALLVALAELPESTEALRRVLDAAGDLDTVATLDRLAWPSPR
jgi:hypothetical protein